MHATLLQFATFIDEAAATSKKLLKQSILAGYFKTLDESDLQLAVRYASGRPFPASDERVLNVGWSAVSDVILSMLKLDPHAFHGLVVRSGEIGEALSRVWALREEDQPLTLMDLARGFDDLAAGASAEHKRRGLLELFSRCAHPREAAYLAKIIFREMRSGAREGVLQASVALAFDVELSRLQRCQLLVGDLDQVAVLAKRKALDSARFTLFHPIQFMLATPQETAELAARTMDGRTFFAEDKLDGIRAQVHKAGDRVAIYTRTMDRTDDSFPDVVSQVIEVPGDFLLDGEIVPYRNGQVLPFAHIQRRLGRKAISAKMLREDPATFIAFDILYKDGGLLIDLPLRERRKALNDLISGAQDNSAALPATAITLVNVATQISRAFDDARGRRNEGIVLKDPESPYSPGRRGQWWFKLKTHLPTFDCVVTAAEYGHGKRRDVLSDYTFAVWDRNPDQPGATLVNIGKAYSGVTDAEIAQLTEVFLQISVGQAGRVHLVEPRIVLEIAFDQIQKSRRHSSGYAFRFPRIKRVRWDKAPRDADVLHRIIEVYESSHNFARPLTAPTKIPEPTLFD